jgi:hypothetical protein
MFYIFFILVYELLILTTYGLRGLLCSYPYSSIIELIL